MRSLLPAVLTALVVSLPASLIAQSEKADGEAKIDPFVARIIKEGRTNNQVQDHLDVLTNRIGPRLSSSEGLQAACEWAEKKFESLGLEARIEKWGEFPVGFERGPAHGKMLSPKEMTLEFGTNAWTAGTKGRVAGNVLLAPKTMEQLEEMRDAIDGSYILVERSRRSRSRRRPTPPSDSENSSGEKANAEPQLTREQAEALREELMKCNPAGLIRSTSDHLIITGGNYRISMDELPTIPQISLLRTQFEEIKKMAEDGEEVEVMFDIRNHFRPGPIPMYNVIADIPGTEFPDQYVVVGGHIDSWDGATGATDNATGCATTIEAARILMAADTKPRRTIRFMLWSGEEQGLLGSRAFVEQHKEDVNKNYSAVFVHDGGTNFVAGLRCTEAMKPDFENIFAAAKTLDDLIPFDIATIETMRPRGGSDHVSFIRAGVPGFFWVQRGGATYRTTHHTQFDTFNTVIPDYQKHSSIVIAIGAYGTANLDGLLPREGVDAGR